MNLRRYVAPLLLTPAAFVALATFDEGTALPQKRHAVNRFELSEPGGDWFMTESLDLRGRGRFLGGVASDWAYEPLRLKDPAAVGQGMTAAPQQREQDVIVDQVFVHARGSVVLFDQLRVGASLPVVVYQDGDDPVRSPRNHQAFGDVRVGSDVQLFRIRETALRAAFGTYVYLPTGSRANYTSDAYVRVAPRFMVAGLLDAFDWAFRVGAMFRDPDAAGGHQLNAALSAGVKVNDRFVIGPEVQAIAGLTHRSFPIELLFGARVKLLEHFQAGSAISGRLTNAEGGPTMRLIALFEYAPDVCIDKDGDGICANEDACPDVDGVRTTDRHTNGCPPDTDGDSIPDRNDKCPQERGSPTVDPTHVGCPDRDKDGVADIVDACPDVVGVPSTTPAENGCPSKEPPKNPEDETQPDERSQ